MLGPQKTNVGGFKGFGFAAKPGTTSKPVTGGFSMAAKPGLPKAKAKTPVVSALFQESMEQDETTTTGVSGLPSWSKLTPEARQAQRAAESLQAEDPSVFQYDEVIDEIKEGMDMEVNGQNVRADAMVQKKRVGLTVPEGADEVKTGTKRTAPKYISQVMIATDRRRVEQQIVEDRLLKKEKDARKDSEVFVTEGFKEELKRRKKFENELEAQEVRDQMLSAEKMENGAGFASMYRNLLNGGLATSRGGEKARELRPAREDEDAKAEVKTEAKDEDEEDKKIKEELAPLTSKAKTEAKEESEQDVAGVQDITAGNPKVAAAAEDLQQREDKALSARERYLARKKGLA